MTFMQTLSAAGFTATVISFGPARMGFGLFVPEFRAAFSMSSTAVGVISGIGFFGFLVGLLLAQPLLGRRGPEAPVVVGLTAATVGMGIVAMATNVVMLATGVFVAASSAGFTWTPFNDAVHRKVSDHDRPGALSRISTGTSLGIAAAAIAAFAVSQSDLSWRIKLGHLRRGGRAGPDREPGCPATGREGPRPRPSSRSVAEGAADPGAGAVGRGLRAGHHVGDLHLLRRRPDDAGWWCAGNCPRGHGGARVPRLRALRACGAFDRCAATGHGPCDPAAGRVAGRGRVGRARGADARQLGGV